MDELEAHPSLQELSQQILDDPAGRLLKLLLRAQPAAVLAGMEVELSRQQSGDSVSG